MDEAYRLAEPRKKGILRLIFSRFFVILALVAIQVILVVMFYIWLDELLPFFSVITACFTFGGVIYLFNCGMDSSAKLTWMFIIALLPITGFMFCADFVRELTIPCEVSFVKLSSYSGTQTTGKVEELIGETKNALPQSEEVMKKLSGDPSGTDELAVYLKRSGCFPVYDKTEVTYFPLGEYKFAAMLEELKKTRASSPPTS